MSNVHIHVPSLNDLKKELEIMGEEKLIAFYSKYESLIGDSDSIEFLEELDKKLKENKK